MASDHSGSEAVTNARRSPAHPGPAPPPQPRRSAARTASIHELLLLSYPTPRCRHTTAPPCRKSTALNTPRPSCAATPRPSKSPADSGAGSPSRPTLRLLPEGGDPEPLKGIGLSRYLTSVLAQARIVGRATLSPAARELWWQIYPQLIRPADGLLGQLPAGAETHTIRLALIYTLLDGQKNIEPEHLHAAVAVWDYARRSAAWALGQATGDPLAEHIHAALPRSLGGLIHTQIQDLCQRNLRPTVSSKHSKRSPPPAPHATNGPSPAAARPSAGPPHRHAAPEPPQPCASGSHRSPSHSCTTTAPCMSPPPSWRAINSESGAVSTRDAPPRAPRHAPPSLPAVTAPDPLIVRSVVSPITALHDTVITHHPACPSTPRAPASLRWGSGTERRGER